MRPHSGTLRKMTGEGFGSTSNREIPVDTGCRGAKKGYATMKKGLLGMMLISLTTAGAGNAELAPRTEILLSSAPWQFSGAGSSGTLPEMGSPAFDQAAWQTVQLPHVFQTRANYNGITQGWYYR